MKYAVISINNNQYSVEEGNELLIDKIDKKDLKPEVLLYVDGKDIQIGEPVLKKAKVDVEYIGDEKGKKLHVRKFKAKSRYRRKIGFRPEFTKIRIKKLSA